MTLCASGNARAELLVFGGHNNSEFLGCLDCSQHDLNSIHNPHGQFGSKFSPTSIKNKYSEYGSAYSSYGACNRHATSAPVVVDRSGNYYGKLTLNRFDSQIQAPETIAWLSGVCAQ